MSIDAAYTPQHDIRPVEDYSDAISLFMLSFGAFGIYYERISFSVIAFFVVLSVFINKRKSRSIIPQTLMCLVFTAMTIGMQYVSIMSGLRSYEGRPFGKYVNPVN